MDKLYPLSSKALRLFCIQRIHFNWEGHQINLTQPAGVGWKSLKYFQGNFLLRLSYFLGFTLERTFFKRRASRTQTALEPLGGATTWWLWQPLGGNVIRFWNRKETGENPPL